MKKLHTSLSFLGVLIFFLSACDNNTTNLPTVEKINSIEVPPAPDTAKNNATLAGVDSNSNGVRDDVEIIIASMSKKDTYYSSSYQMAKIEQRLATENILSQEEYNNISNQLMCLDEKRTTQEKGIMSQEDIKGAIVNTRERSAKYYENEKKYGSTWTKTGRIVCN